MRFLLLLIIVILPSLIFAEGPLFTHKDTSIQQEYENVYQDLRKLGNTNSYLSLTASTFTVTSSFTSLGSASIIGTITNDNACSGCVGEFVSSVTAGATNFPSTGVRADLISISLSSGDWNVTGTLYTSANTSGVTLVEMGITDNAGNTTGGMTFGINRVDFSTPTANTGSFASIPNYRYSVNHSTTVYLKYTANYTTGNPQARGALRARRER